MKIKIQDLTGAVLEALTHERDRAIMEGERNASLTAFDHDGRLTLAEERLYEAAFTNGWDRHAAVVAPTSAPMSPANRLVAYSAATRLRELGFEWDATAEAWLQPAPSAQAADSVPAEPLQDFESPNAQALMRAWEEGWEACRDAEYVGEEAQNDAFNNSNTLVICIAEDQRLPMPARAPAESVQEDAA